ncbi:MAG: transglutaminase-like domain-containing protein [Methanobacteriaceae archaeon]|nr:transglutaminase-like domain-containing protein [Methanobacteriaceae archaeon]
MNLIPLKDDINEYLLSSEILDFDNKIVSKKASELSKGLNDIQKVKSLYEFVRDKIDHSSDIYNNEISFKASDVLNKGHGICFAKSHLLAALLRCEKIPTGFCYQKVFIGSEKILHGLNGLFLNEKWFRLDARGNVGGINANFSINEEKLAYKIKNEFDGVDYPYVHSKPIPEIIKIFKNYSALDEAINQILHQL